MLNKVTLSFPWPYLHGLVFRTPPVVPKVELEKAIFNFNWLAAPGTGVLAAALSTGIFLRLSRDQWAHAIRRTGQRMKVPLLTIGLVLGLGFVTRYSGTDAIIGLAFTKTGTFYPFFAAVIGWLGVFLTGSDTSSNALFGSLQKITAQQLHLDPVLITAANSTGGVMGKMIDAQSIVVSGGSECGGADFPEGFLAFRRIGSPHGALGLGPVDSPDLDDPALRHPLIPRQSMYETTDEHR